MLTSNTLKINYKNDLCYITFDCLEKTGLVRHAFSTRYGGVSNGQFSTMNLSFSNGDNCNAVMKNYNILCDAIGINKDRLVFSKQTHTVNIRTISSDDVGKGIIKKLDYDNVDALITNQPGIGLVTQFADCVPVLFLDHKKKVIASAHAGWRGTVGRIAALTVEQMQRDFGCRPQDIISCIAPSIGPCCFEVDQPVYDEFLKLNGIDINEIAVKLPDGKYKVNLWETNRKILLQTGVMNDNITLTDLCTVCCCDAFHSHRATGGKRGNLAAIISLV